MLHGIDISKWQGDVNWETIKADENFVIIKSSEGDPDPGQSVAQYEDPKFKENQAGARAVGILRGYYHFARPDFNAPEGEAQECFDAIGGLQEGEIVCLDMETAGQTGASSPVEWALRWLNHFSALAGGMKPLIYLSESWVNSHDWSPVFNIGYGLWVAKYGANDGSVPSGVNTGIWPTAAIWQYTSVADAAGIHPVDADNFYGDEAAFEKYGFHAPQAPAAAGEPTPPAPSVPPVDAISHPANPEPESDVTPSSTPESNIPLNPENPPVNEISSEPQSPTNPSTGVQINADALPTDHAGKMNWLIATLREILNFLEKEI